MSRNLLEKVNFLLGYFIFFKVTYLNMIKLYSNILEFISKITVATLIFDLCNLIAVNVN